jgi:hypothetical protein
LGQFRVCKNIPANLQMPRDYCSKHEHNFRLITGSGINGCEILKPPKRLLHIYHIQRLLGVCAIEDLPRLQAWATYRLSLANSARPPAATAATNGGQEPVAARWAALAAGNWTRHCPPPPSALVPVPAAPSLAPCGACSTPAALFVRHNNSMFRAGDGTCGGGPCEIALKGVNCLTYRRQVYKPP